jgi:peptidoglycan/LPS O-acetylase OafA/YrhL
MSSPLQRATNDTRHLDGLRIVAAAAVVILHYCEYAKSHPAAKAVFDHVQHFNLFVDLFFVISGFVIAKQYLDKVGNSRGIARFLWRRVARIYPLHLLTLAFYLAIAMALQLGIARGDNPARYPLSDIPAQLLMLHAVIGERLTFNFPSWSLSAEMICYLLFPLLAAAAATRRVLAPLIAVLALCANSAVSLTTDAGPWTDWINHGGAFRALPSFALGVSLCLFRTEIARPMAAAPFTLLTLVFIVAGGFLPSSLGLVFVYAIAILGARADLTEQSTAFARMRFERWSDLTYPVYMLHIPVATLVLSILGRYVSSFVADARLVLIPLAIVVLIVLSHLSLRYFETPIRRALTDLYDQRHGSGISLRATAPGGGPR